MTQPAWIASTVAAVVAVTAAGIATARWRRRRVPRGDGATGRWARALERLVDGDVEGAFAALEALVRAGGAPPEAYVRLGILLRERGDAERALQIHRSLTVRERLEPNVRRRLVLEIAEDYAALGRPAKAVEVIDAAGRDARRDGEVLRVLAREAQRAGDRPRAFEVLQARVRAGDLAERHLAVFLAEWARELSAAGQEREARKRLQRALRIDPDCVAARMLEGELAQARGDLDTAIDAWKAAACASALACPEALGRIERAAFRAGRFGDVEAVYRAVLDARPDDETAVSALAAFHRKQGRLDDAVARLEAFVEEHPGARQAALTLASCLAERGDTSRIAELVETMRERARPKRWRCRCCGRVDDTLRFHCPACDAFESHEPVP